MSTKPPEPDMAKSATVAQEKERIDIETSRQKRIERVKAKHRDRGGIYKPKETNPLIDILLSKDVTGLSPSKKAAQRRRSSAAPRASTRRKSMATDTATGTRSQRKSSLPRKEAAQKDNGSEVEEAPIKSTHSTSSSHRKSSIPSKKPKGSRAGSPPVSRKSTGEPSSKDVANSTSKKKSGQTAALARPDETTRKPTEKSQTFPLVDLSSVAGPSNAPSQKAPKKRGRTVIDTDEIEAGEEAEFTAPLRTSPRKRPKTDSVPVSASVDSKPKEKPPSKRKGKAKVKEAIVDETDAIREPSRTNNSTTTKPSAKSTSSSRQKKSQPVSEDEGSVTAVESDADKRRATKQPRKRRPARGKGKAANKTKSRKKTGSESGSDVEPGPSRRRSQYPAPNLDTVYEESEAEGNEIHPAQQQSTSKQSASSQGSSENGKRQRMNDPADGEELLTSSRKRYRPTAGRDDRKSKQDDPSKPDSLSRATAAKKVDGVIGDQDEVQKRSKPTPKSVRYEIDDESPGENRKSTHDVEGQDEVEPSKPMKASSRNSAAKLKPQQERGSKSDPSEERAARSTRPTRSKSKPVFPKAKEAAVSKSSFANQPTLLFSSPVKPHDAEPDEIDFLS